MYTYAYFLFVPVYPRLQVALYNELETIQKEPRLSSRTIFTFWAYDIVLPSWPARPLLLAGQAASNYPNLRYGPRSTEYFTARGQSLPLPPCHRRFLKIHNSLSFPHAITLGRLLRNGPQSDFIAELGLASELLLYYH